MASERLDFVFTECRNSRESQIRISPLAQALSVNIILCLVFQVELCNITYTLFFIQMETCCTLYNVKNILHMEVYCRAHSLGGIVQFLVRIDYTWIF